MLCVVYIFIISLPYANEEAGFSKIVFHDTISLYTQRKEKNEKEKLEC